MLAFEEASNFARTVDNTFLFIVLVSLFFLLLVTGLMITFIIKYNKKRHKKAVNIHGNVPLEVAWTVIPTLIVLVMFWYGWRGYKEEADIPDNAYVVNVQAQMWQWKFTYPNGVQTTDTLYVPVNTPVKVNLKSLDVNHSFYVPAFRFKKDVIPNRQNTAWFRAIREGEYNLFCAEYCGMKHAYMRAKVIVMPINDFNKLIDSKASSNAGSPASDTTINASGADSTKAK